MPPLRTVRGHLPGKCLAGDNETYLPISQVIYNGELTASSNVRLRFVFTVGENENAVEYDEIVALSTLPTSFESFDGRTAGFDFGSEMTAGGGSIPIDIYIIYEVDGVDQSVLVYQTIYIYSD